MERWNQIGGILGFLQFPSDLIGQIFATLTVVVTQNVLFPSKHQREHF